MDYIVAFKEAQTQKGWIVYSASDLFELIKPYHQGFPLTQAQLGRDLNKCDFVKKKRTRTHNTYAIHFDC